MLRRDVVRVAVEFDHQPVAATREVGEVWAQRYLAAELRAQLAARQVSPQMAFGGGGGVAQFLCPRCIAGFPAWHWPFLPTPDPSRKR